MKRLTLAVMACLFLLSGVASADSTEIQVRCKGQAEYISFQSEVEGVSNPTVIYMVTPEKYEAIKVLNGSNQFKDIAKDLAALRDKARKVVYFNY